MNTWKLGFHDGTRTFELLINYPPMGHRDEVWTLGEHLAKRLDLDFMYARHPDEED